ncbi:hypothetical protein B0H13DRAFT_1890306 [Mycena leptocephala]|nr:hypothetical protein B0H13DRAFT_1890306 [Mycena leptocephala]
MSSIQSNNQASSHYREHTREQDGWTVLAPAPGAEPAGDLPPPYTPEAAAAPPTAGAAPAATTGPDQQQHHWGDTGYSHASYGRDVPFSVGYVEICNMMGLDPSRACIGFKWDNERANVATHVLSNATDWNNCLESGLGQAKRARTRKVVCMIKNLNLPTETALATPPITPVLHPTGSKKRKSAARSGNSSGERKTFDYTREFRELKARLACAAHKGELCFVSQVDGHHHRVDVEHASLWAKEISAGNATSNRPPENIMFQEFFLPGPKRARNTRSQSSTNPCAPTIHVTVNTGASGSNGVTLSPPRASPPRRSPLATITAASANADNRDVPVSPNRTDVFGGDENGSPGIRYPPVTDILQLIDDSGRFEDSDVLPFPSIIFADTLRDFQITHVDQVPILDAEFYVQQIDMPIQLAELFVEESIAAIGRAQKGKYSA